MKLRLKSYPILREKAKKLMHTHLMLVEHLPKVLIARMLIEPSSTARKNVIISWLHFHFICSVCCISSGFVWIPPMMKGGDLFLLRSVTSITVVAAVYFAHWSQPNRASLWTKISRDLGVSDTNTLKKASCHKWDSSCSRSLNLCRHTPLFRPKSARWLDNFRQNPLLRPICTMLMSSPILHQ